jgi:hypothetical protein
VGASGARKRGGQAGGGVRGAGSGEQRARTAAARTRVSSVKHLNPRGEASFDAPIFKLVSKLFMSRK